MTASAEIARREIQEFSKSLKAFQSQRMDVAAFRKARLQLGIYSMKALTGFHMIRVRIPCGDLSAVQLDGLADMADAYSDRSVHITTRQDFQFYNVPAAALVSFLEAVRLTGLTTREAAGNVVRNVTACPYAKHCPQAGRDVRSVAESVNACFLRNPDTQEMPRKVKIAFSGCVRDCALTQIHDVGGISVISRQNGREQTGMRLTFGGGLGASPRRGFELEPFTPLSDILPTIEAILKVFNQRGDRVNKKKARLKFLVEKMGAEPFRRAVIAQRGGASRRPGDNPESILPLLSPPSESAPLILRVPLGDLTSDQLRLVSRLSKSFGQGAIRLTQDQNIVFPEAGEETADAMRQELKGSGLSLARPGVFNDVTSCPGSRTCLTGTTYSKGMARELTALLDKEVSDSVADFQDVTLKVSGCPNSCGQHHVASVGLWGNAKKIHNHYAPFYGLLVGGGVEGGVTRFGRPVLNLPAKKVPEAIRALIAAYRKNRGMPALTFKQFLNRISVEALRGILASFAVLPPPEEAPDLYRDYGETAAFAPTAAAQGECAE